jgi:hypothetical protein
MNFCSKGKIYLFSGISGGVRRIFLQPISEKAVTSPLLIKRSVEKESKLVLLLHILLNLSDILRLTKSSLSVLKYG